MQYIGCEIEDNFLLCKNYHYSTGNIFYTATPMFGRGRQHTEVQGVLAAGKQQFSVE
jgi:hypothetical protein